jgi:hypothetical protein
MVPHSCTSGCSQGCLTPAHQDARKGHLTTIYTLQLWRGRRSGHTWRTVAAGVSPCKMRTWVYSAVAAIKGLAPKCVGRWAPPYSTYEAATP